MKECLLDFSQEELKEILLSLGEKAFRTGQIYKSLHLGKDFDEMTDISKVDDDTCRFETSGSYSTIRGRASVSTIKSSNMVNFYIGNKTSITGTASFGGTVTVNQTYASYTLVSHGGYANGGLFVDYKGVCWKLSMTVNKYTKFSYESDEVIDDGSVADTASTGVYEINTGKENLRDSAETAKDWTSIFKSTTFTVTLFA